MQKRAAISILKESIPGKFPSIKIILITEAEIESITHSLKHKERSSCYEKISKILQDSASLIRHP